jgi:predicted enzyme related to lactoylglutathione lyase
MPKRNAYDQGTPNWVDLQTTDTGAAKEFYAGLFGWSYDDQPMGEGAVYSMATLRGEHVAAIAPQSPELAAAGAPPMWNTYLAVDSADDAVSKVEAAGGQVAMAPFDVMDAGRMAFILDPAGAAVAFWQARNHNGASLVNEPGTVIWNELVAADPPAAARFYEQVLGLSAETVNMGEGEYTMFQAAGRPVGGTTKPQAEGVPGHWHVYFAAAGADVTAAKAGELGGAVLVQPFDTAAGRMAVLRDPQGATFSIIQPPEQPAEP